MVACGLRYPRYTVVDAYTGRIMYSTCKVFQSAYTSSKGIFKDFHDNYQIEILLITIISKESQCFLTFTELSHHTCIYPSSR